MDSSNNRYLEFTNTENSLNNAAWYFGSLCADWTSLDNDGNTRAGTGTDTSDGPALS